MLSGKTAVYNVLHSRDTCTLCFHIINEETSFFHVDDNIVVKENDETADITFTQIIATLLAVHDASTVITRKICKPCATSAIYCFKFINRCRQSRLLLTNTISKLSSCLNDSKIDTESTKTLYVANDENGQFLNYSDKLSKAKTTSKVLRRFKTIVKRQRRAKQAVKVENNYNDEFDNDTIDTNPAELKLPNGSHDSFLCELCSAKYTDRKGLKSHFERTHAPKIHKCPDCPKAFGAAYLLKMHAQDSHIAAICDVCGKKYANRHSLKMHSYNHANLRCPICNRHYKSRFSFKKHVDAKICTKEVGWQKKDNGNKNFFCDSCGKGFAKKYSLYIHIKFEHEKSYKSFDCAWCDKKFPAASRLKYHMVKHTRERNFTCETCGGKFVTKPALVYHTRIHTGETPYACEFCDMKFLSTSRRMDHVRRRHMGATQQCDICSSKFKTPSGLRKHRRRHFNPSSKLFVQNVPALPGNVEV
ncbi:myoneurin [Plutella xylostella]|uniref:myoneurin n=1 Tax=Plutella xylostella TaxID=51655 RepID=UPI0020330BB4|nr:myoneurin [Plutella xylostella]